MSDVGFVPETGVYLLRAAGWRALHGVRARLAAGSEVRATLSEVLDEVQRETEGSVQLIRWQVDDLVQGIADALGVGDGSAAPFGIDADEFVGLTREIARRARRPLEDAQLEAGWDVIGWVARDVLREHGLLQ